MNQWHKKKEFFISSCYQSNIYILQISEDVAGTEAGIKKNHISTHIYTKGHTYRFVKFLQFSGRHVHPARSRLILKVNTSHKVLIKTEKESDSVAKTLEVHRCKIPGRDTYEAENFLTACWSGQEILDSVVWKSPRLKLCTLALLASC